MAIEESRELGLHWPSRAGRLWAVCMVVLAVMTMVAGVTYSLTARLGLRAYYTSAHAFGLLVFVAGFVVAHHLLRVRRGQGCGPRKYAWSQLLLNIFYLLCMISLSLGYTLLALRSVNTSLDYVAAASWSWLGVLFLLYLSVVSLAAVCSEWHSSYDLKLARASFIYQPAPAENIPLKQREELSESQATLTPTSTQCKHCLKSCYNVLFIVLHVVFHLVLAIVIVLSALHTFGVLSDYKQYRPTEHLYTVNVEGHKPVALFLQCRGNGSETVVLENGLGGTAYMAWHFLPRLLEDDYTVCVHDRRDIGWSEGFQNDLIPTIWDEKQGPLSSSEYFRELVRKADIKTPFYYAGHSYGGPHIATVALKYPELVKGLIFLDSSRFSVADDYGDYLEPISNFLPLGFLRIALNNGLNFEEIMADTIAMSEMPQFLKEQYVATLRSGNYFPALLREHRYLIGTDLEPLNQVHMLLESVNATIDVPVLVIDAGTRSGDRDWFPGQFFPQYTSDFHFINKNATHESMMYTTDYANVTAQFIRDFLQSFDKANPDSTAI